MEMSFAMVFRFILFSTLWLFFRQGQTDLKR